jgi:murein L,D-transpeptidase YafK
MRRRHLQCAVLIGGALLAGTVGDAKAQLARELGLPVTDSVAGLNRVAVLPTESGFALDQLRNERVLEARLSARFNIKRLFHERRIRYPAAETYLRIFKRERSLELWVRPAGDPQFTLLKTYAICALAGELGPKTRQGDAQVPEGFYYVDFFNPRSDYYLSLHLDYPNQRDRLSSAATDLGGDIYIHGGCNSEGCLAVTDEGIKELYWMAVEARAVGQQRIPVHIFPARLATADMQALQNVFSTRPDLTQFWATLKPAYDFFEETRTIPAIAVDARGTYRVNGAAELGTPATLGTPAGTVEKQPTKPKGPIGTPVGSGRGG